MKLKLIKFLILVPMLVAGLSACNSTTEDTTDGNLNYSGLDVGSSTLVESFSIRPNAKVMANLDSVHFSINQQRGEIYNADSLPWGTDVRKLVVSVQVPATSGVEIVMPKLSDGTDTIIDLLTNGSDSINFSRGSVWLRVTSSNEDYERVYTVRVNVHACNPDSLQWDMRPNTLPSSLQALREQKTVEFQGRSYCLARNATITQMSTAASPDIFSWDVETLSDLPADTDINSLTATDDALYLLTASGTLLSSSDGFTWNEADTGWTHLYGGFGSDVVGVRSNGDWGAYPSGKGGRPAAEMPVSGTSQMWTYTTEWSIEPQAMLVGGVTSDGSYSPNAWGFDGDNWIRLSGSQGAYMLPRARGMILFPYFTFRTDSKTFQVTRHSAWLATGGQLADGSMNRTVYVTLDNGVNWRTATDDLQLPSEMASRRNADVLLSEKHFDVSRAATAITQWDAPYIYMFGGYNSNSTLYNQVWSGVINRMTFKPLQ